MDIFELLELLKAHDVQVTIIPSKGPFRDDVKFRFSKDYCVYSEFISETALRCGPEDHVKYIFEKSIQKLEDLCKNDQT